MECLRNRKVDILGHKLKLMENRKIKRIKKILGLTADDIIAGGGPTFGVLFIGLPNKANFGLLFVGDKAFLLI